MVSRIKNNTNREGDIMIGVLIGFILTIILLSASRIIFPVENISQETLNDVCINLSNNTASIGTVYEGKLICEVPSYDSTQNIIIKNNGEAK